MKRFYKYKDGTQIKLSDKFFRKFRSYKDAYFIFEYDSVDSIILFDDCSSVEELLDYLVDSFYHRSFFKSKKDYRAAIYNFMYDINIDNILDDDFNQTIFYKELVKNNYIIEIN